MCVDVMDDLGSCMQDDTQGVNTRGCQVFAEIKRKKVSVIKVTYFVAL
jgi:hypothetical protein